MAVRNRSTKTVKESVDSSSPAKSKTRNILGLLGKINIIYLLFFLLIIASFLIGVLVTQVQYLKNGTTVAGNNNVYAGDPQQPTQPTGPVDVEEGHLPILGDQDAKVTIIEFSDFQCPFCKSLYDDTLGQVKKEYIETGKAKLAYRHYPLTSIHPNAQKAAEASECANEEGKFWEYHDQLFENQTEWEALSADEALNKFVEYANTVGVNGETLRECVSSGRMAEKVQEDLDAGSKIGVDGTPATFVNGILVSGAVPFSEFKTQIDAALNE